MPFGSLISNQTGPFVEQPFNISGWGVNLSQGQTWSPQVSTFTMPFQGHIFVDLWVQTSYFNGATILASSVWPATPLGPTNYYAGKVTQWNINTGTFPVPFFGWWANLAAGTYFDLTINIRCDICNGLMQIQQAHGFIRAIAS
jgi:hypothetical protein